jgi:surface protein
LCRFDKKKKFDKYINIKEHIMGRPIKDKFFGDPSGPFKQFDDIDAWIPGEAGEEKCYIVRQKTTHKYIMYGKTSNAKGRCQLVDKAAGSLAEGEMMMTCTPFGGSPERVKAMSQNKIKTFAGNRYRYAKNKRAEKAGECDLSSYNGRPFITTWRTTTPNEDVTIPLRQGTATDANIHYDGGRVTWDDWPGDEDNNSAFDGIGPNGQDLSVTRAFRPQREVLVHTYNFLIDWGDGNTDLITSWDQAELTHTYAIAGDYDVSIYGRCDEFSLDSITNTGVATADIQAKLIDIKQWGDIEWKTLALTTYGAINLTSISATDAPNLSQCTSIYGTFRNCGLTGTLDLRSWDVSKVDVIFDLIRDSIGITTLDMRGWDTSNIIAIYGNFRYSSANGGENSLTILGMDDWDVSNLRYFTSNFVDSSALYNTGLWRTRLAPGHVINLTKWNTNKLFSLLWAFTHVNIDDFVGFENWDTSHVYDFEMCFGWSFGTRDLILDRWDFSNAGLMYYMFVDCNLGLLDIRSWDLKRGQLSTVGGLFSYKTTINDLKFYMRTFCNGTKSTYSIFDPNSSSITAVNSDYMEGYNPAGSWDAGYMYWPTVMDSAGITDELDSLVERFNTNGVYEMPYYLWQYGVSGNRTDVSLDLTRWDVGQVRDFRGLFEESRIISLDISTWDTSSAASMGEMFEECFYLQSLDLSNFDTSSVTSMRYMFKDCSVMTTLLIPNFDFSKVTDLRSFFQSSPNIDMSQIDIASWDISSVTLASNFMLNGPTMTTAQYDALLIAWSQLPVQPNVTWHFGAAQYTSGGAAEAARDVLTGAPNNWIITDGGSV